METPCVGDRHTFTPAYAYTVLDPRDKDRRSAKNKITVTGRVISVNRDHRHFTVAYEIDGVTQKETFKF